MARVRSRLTIVLRIAPTHCVENSNDNLDRRRYFLGYCPMTGSDLFRRRIAFRMGAYCARGTQEGPR